VIPIRVIFGQDAITGVGVDSSGGS